MGIFGSWRKKTIADYTEKEILDDSSLKITRSKLLAVVLESLRTLTPEEIIAHESIFSTSIGLLDNTSELTAEELRQLIDSVPDLIKMIDKVTPSTRSELLSLISHLEPESAREDFLSRLKKMCNSQTVLTDHTELRSLQALIHYFVRLPDERTFESLKLCYSRMNNSRLQNDSFAYIGTALIDALGLLATNKNHQPSILFLEKIARGYVDSREAKVYLEGVRDKKIWTLLEVLEKAKDDELREYLKDSNVDINAKGTNGITPLMHAARPSGDPQCLQILIDHGAEVNARNNNGETALMYAVTAENIDKIQLLVRNGADVNASNHNGRTPLIMACTGASGFLRKDIIEFLIQNGANTDTKDNWGNTPASLASAIRGSEEIVELLTRRTQKRG